MKAFAVGALGLVLLQVALASPLTAPRLGQLGADLSHAIARFVDPTVPLIGSTANASTASTPPAPAAGTYTPGTGGTVLIPNAGAGQSPQYQLD